MTDRYLALEAGQLAEMLSRAAHDGAKQALKEIGLADDGAGADVRELRSLLESWRQFKQAAARTLWQALARWTIRILIALLFYGAGYHRLGPVPFWLHLTDPH